jgi:5-methylcytosine-specific restriction endonuclease McrA
MPDSTSDQPQLKTCTKCGAEHPRTPEYFSRDKSRKDGLYPQCKACKSEDNACYREENREKERERRARWRAANPEHEVRYRAENAEKKREYDARYREENREKRRENIARWQKKNPDKTSGYNARWAKANPEKCNANTQRYLARKRGAEGSFTSADIKRQTKAQRGKCYYCGKKRKLTIEHLVPLNRGGSNNPDNIVMACQSCNSSKCDKLPHEFPKGGRLL